MALSSPAILTLFISGALGASYSPGTPGAEWSTETQKVTKAKLYRIFSPHQSLDLYKDLHPEGKITDNSVTLDDKKTEVGINAQLCKDAQTRIPWLPAKDGWG